MAKTNIAGKTQSMVKVNCPQTSQVEWANSTNAEPRCTKCGQRHPAAK